eukprot:TRINITY_DN594_c1_g1_i1.p1 TRINITY_DN594_c1_g1~~TRINITY_DN594_c1_g1_i1.p1  ORF type:complete len:242 (+),score=27.22 TRINITY_DN594_c1_g1_i1:151-876(+)
MISSYIHLCSLLFLAGICCTQFSFVAESQPSPTPIPASAIFVAPIPTPNPSPSIPSPIPTPPNRITANIRSPSPSPSPPFQLDLDITARTPAPDGNPPFSISPIIAAPTPSADDCSTKLDKLEECLNKKADFVAQGLMYYSYNIQRSCFCFPEGYTQQVSVSVCDSDQSEPDFYTDHNTMIKVFDFVCQAIKEADSVDVTYDNTYHYPLSISVDYIELAADDVVSYTISNFQVLTQNTCIV